MNLREFFDRYGVPLGALLALTLAIALLPGNTTGANRLGTSGSGPGGTRSAAGGPGGFASGGAAAGGGVAGGVAGGAGGVGSSGARAGTGEAAGGAAPGSVVFGQGPNCRPDGRQIGISYYMPPCVQWSGGDNGGATAAGVSANNIKIIRWNGQIPPATQAILQANKLGDDRAVVERAYRALFNYSNWHYETYGREVTFENYDARAEATNDEVMIADAAAIADKKPFAVIEGNPAAPMPTVMIRELNARGVTCLCSTSLPSAFYAENPYVMATGLPTGDDYANMAAEYAGKRLKGRVAQYAGDELNPLQNFKTKQRVFGLIYLNGQMGKVDPEGERLRAAAEAAFARYGITFAKQVGYLYDPGNNQDKISNMISQMKDAGVTTIVPLWDPLQPILITAEATRQNYYPEWMVVGTGLSDTTTAGRLYDQFQWRHAFGITPLWVTWVDRTKGTGWREYHDARPQDSDNSEGVLIEIYRARIQTLFRGIHMAGPKLTPSTFRDGMFAYPPTGGQPKLPLVYSTPESPTDIKDFAEVFYDANARGPDERSQDGVGMMMKTDGGARYQLGQWPTDDPHVFRPGGLAVSDDPALGADPPYEHKPYPTSGCLSCP